VHEFRTLSAEQARELLAQRWRPGGVAVRDSLELDPETVDAIIWATGGNFFRLLGRLLTHASGVNPRDQRFNSGEHVRKVVLSGKK
jgi:hypothetical protein